MALDFVHSSGSLEPVNGDGYSCRGGVGSALNSRLLAETESYDLWQRTIARAILFRGIGVHSGEHVAMQVRPGRAGGGIVFLVGEGTAISASINHWKSEQNDLSTALVGADGVSVRTVEHLMAAFAFCGVDNAEVLLQGSEVPILDGSAEPFVREILAVGLKKQQHRRSFLKIVKPYSYHGQDDQAGKSISFRPLEGDEPSTLTINVDYSETISQIGKRSCSLELTPGVLRAELANCRTFGLECQLAGAQQNGVALGASSDNTVLFHKTATNHDLRCADEPVRHKALDMIGDLYLAPGLLRGHLVAYKPSHRLNGLALKELLANHAAVIAP